MDPTMVRLQADVKAIEDRLRLLEGVVAALAAAPAAAPQPVPQPARKKARA